MTVASHRPAVSADATFVIAGDSITHNTGDRTGLHDPGYGSADKNFLFAQGYWSWFAARLDARPVLLRNAGLGGDDIDGLTSRLTDQVLAYNPGWCIVNIGTADVAGGDTYATITGKLATVFDRVRSAGIRLVATTILPRTSFTATQLQVCYRVNEWIRDYGDTEPGTVLVDWHTLMADPSDGAPRTGMTLDGTHPSVSGAARMGKMLADAIGPMIGGARTLAPSAADDYQLIANPFLTGTAGTAGTDVTGDVADSWTVQRQGSVSSAIVASKVARTDGMPGEWQQVALTSGRSLTIQGRFSKGTGWDTGDQVYAECEFERDDDWSGIEVFALRLSANGDTSIAGEVLGGSNLLSEDGFVPMSGVLRTPPFTVTESATGLTPKVDFGASDASACTGTLRLGSFALRKVPTL